MKKDKLFREGKLPQVLSFNRLLYASVAEKFASDPLTPVAPQPTFLAAPPPPSSPAHVQQYLLDPESDTDAEEEKLVDSDESCDESARTIII